MKIRKVPRGYSLHFFRILGTKLKKLIEFDKNSRTCYFNHAIIENQGRMSVTKSVRELADK